MPRTQPDRSFQAAVPGFLAYLTERERSPNTVRGYKADIRTFAAWYEATMEQPLASVLDITAVELREWRREMIARGQKPASVNRRLSAVQSFEHWAADTGIIPGAPERPTSCRQQRAAPRWLDRKERLAFLRAVEHGSPRDRAVAIVFLNTGLRVAEMAVLLWTDIVISERKGTLLVRHGKGYKRRDVPLNDDARKRHCRPAMLPMLARMFLSGRALGDRLPSKDCSASLKSSGPRPRSNGCPAISSGIPSAMT